MNRYWSAGLRPGQVVAPRTRRAGGIGIYTTSRSPRGTSGERPRGGESLTKHASPPRSLLLPASGGEGEKPRKHGVPDLCRYQWPEAGAPVHGEEKAMPQLRSFLNPNSEVDLGIAQRSAGFQTCGTAALLPTLHDSVRSAGYHPALPQVGKPALLPAARAIAEFGLNSTAVGARPPRASVSSPLPSLEWLAAAKRCGVLRSVIDTCPGHNKTHSPGAGTDSSPSCSAQFHSNEPSL